MSPSLPRPRLPRLRRGKGDADEQAAPESEVVPPPPADPPADQPEEAPERPVIEMPSQAPKEPRQPGRVRSALRRAARGVGGVLRGIGAGLALAGSYVAEVGRELGLAIGDAGRGIAAAWRGVDVYMRRRLAVAVAIVAAAIAFLVLAVPALPCQYPGGQQCPPPDNAASLVPADALAYLHLDTDVSSEQYQEANGIASELPLLSSQVAGRLLGQLPLAGGGAADFTTSVRPWLGGEAALALLPGAGAPQEVELLSVAGRDLAEKYQARLAGPRSETIPYRGVHLVRGRGGIASAFVGGFLVIGTTAGTEAVIDVETNAQGTTPLSDSPAATVRDQLSEQRLADAYLSPAGAAAIAGRPTGALAPLAPFFAPRSTKGVAIGVVAASSGLEFQIRSALDPKRVAASPGFFAAFPSFEPSLGARLPANTLAYFGLGHPGSAISALITQAGTEEPGLSRALAGVLAHARRASGLDLNAGVSSALGTEGALALEPGASGGTPYVVYIGSGIEQKRELATLAHLQAPITRALVGKKGSKAPRFRADQVAGIKIQTLAVSPVVELSYGIVDGDIVVGTSPEAIAAVARGGLGETPNYQEATAGFEGPTSLVTYLDLRGLITLAEQAGLATDPAYTTFSSDFHKLQALALSVNASPSALDTDGRLVVGSGSLQSRPPTTGDNEPAPKTFR